MTNAEMQAQLAKLKAENDALKAAALSKIKLKVSEKGGLSVYGLGRFPVTLYREQWETLLGKVEELKAFIAANADKLKVKGE